MSVKKQRVQQLLKYHPKELAVNFDYLQYQIHHPVAKVSSPAYQQPSRPPPSLSARIQMQFVKNDGNISKWCRIEDYRGKRNLLKHIAHVEMQWSANIILEYDSKTTNVVNSRIENVPTEDIQLTIIPIHKEAQ